MGRRVETRQVVPQDTKIAGCTRRSRLAAQVAVVCALVVFGSGMNPVAAADRATKSTSDAVSVFASVPAPGHPFGRGSYRERSVVLLTICPRQDDTRRRGTTPDDTERHVEPGLVRSVSNLRIRWPRGRGSSSLPSRTALSSGNAHSLSHLTYRAAATPCSRIAQARSRKHQHMDVAWTFYGLTDESFTVRFHAMVIAT